MIAASVIRSPNMARSRAAGLVIMGKNGNMAYPSTVRDGVGPLGSGGSFGESGIGSICMGDDGLESGIS
jgi:hypothetical protein